MSRLIDADMVISIAKGEFGEEDLSKILWLISLVPIAYDVDKVVEQMEDRSALWSPVGWRKSYKILALDAAIKTVKGGGVNG